LRDELQSLEAALPNVASENFAGHLADAVLVLHVAVVAFVIFGQIAIIVGGAFGAQSICNFWFRATHISLIVFIALETTVGATCPLTWLEQLMRRNAGQPTYSESFVQHWLAPLIFFDAPWWAFLALYVFTALVVISLWFLVPPKWPTATSKSTKSLQ
jgi:Protein of Unknown function (DUF2784)